MQINESNIWVFLRRKRHAVVFTLFAVAISLLWVGCKKDVNQIGRIIELEATVSYSRPSGQLLAGDSLLISLTLSSDPIDALTGEQIDISNLSLLFTPDIWSFDGSIHGDEFAGHSEALRFGRIQGTRMNSVFSGAGDFLAELVGSEYKIDLRIDLPAEEGDFLIWWDIPHSRFSNVGNIGDDLILLRIRNERESGFDELKSKYPGLLESKGITENHAPFWFIL